MVNFSFPVSNWKFPSCTCLCLSCPCSFLSFCCRFLRNICLYPLWVVGHSCKIPSSPTSLEAVSPPGWTNSVSVAPHIMCSSSLSILDDHQIGHPPTGWPLSLGGPKLAPGLQMQSHEYQIKVNNQFSWLTSGAKEMLWDTIATDTAEPFETAASCQCQWPAQMMALGLFSLYKVHTDPGKITFEGHEAPRGKPESSCWAGFTVAAVLRQSG